VEDAGPSSLYHQYSQCPLDLTTLLQVTTTTIVYSYMFFNNCKLVILMQRPAVLQHNKQKKQRRGLHLAGQYVNILKKRNSS